MDQDQNEGIAKLSDVEKTSDNYLNELRSKLHDIQLKLAEEKTVSNQLEEISCSLQGRISVHYQRADELELENFNEIMTQAEEELANAKDECLGLASEMLCGYYDMMKDVQNETARLEGIRIQFKSPSSVEKCTEAEALVYEEKKTEITCVENEIQTMDKCDEEILLSMQAYDQCEHVMEFYLSELEETEEEITNLSLKLHGSQSSFSFYE